MESELLKKWRKNSLGNLKKKQNQKMIETLQKYERKVTARWRTAPEKKVFVVSIYFFLYLNQNIVNKQFTSYKIHTEQ